VTIKTETIERWVKARIKLGISNPDEIVKDIIKERSEVQYDDRTIGRICTIAKQLLQKQETRDEKGKEKEIWIPALDEESFKIIHPSIDFSADVCYIGTRIPCKSSNTNKLKLKQVLISESGEIFPLNSDTLAERNIELETEPMNIKPRWGFASINEFVKNPRIVDETNITEIFNAIRNQYEYFVYFEEKELYDILTCWKIGTYFYQLFDKYPYFQLKGIQGSGKTKTAKIVGWTAFNGQLGLDYSRSSIFRTVHSTRGTQIIDENETLGTRSEAKQNIEDLLNAGFEKGIPVPRVERIKEDGIEKFVTIYFEVYSPKFIANIKGISKASTSERTIEATMVKCGKKEQGNRIPEFDDPRWQSIRDTLYYCTFKYWKLVKEVKEKVKKDIKEEITARDLDVWLPVLTIANLIGDEVYNKIKEASKKFIKQKRVEIAEKSEEANLLRILLKKEIFEEIFNAKLKDKGYGTYLDDDINKTPKYYIKDITNYLTGTLNWNIEYTTERSIGRRITTLKCFVDKGNDGTGIWYKFTPKRLEEIKESFGWEFEEDDKDES